MGVRRENEAGGGGVVVQGKLIRADDDNTSSADTERLDGGVRDNSANPYAGIVSRQNILK